MLGQGKVINVDGYREALEEMVEIVVTTRKTADAILFKGKRRYLLPVPRVMRGTQDHIIIEHAVHALQYLYRAEQAAKQGNVKKTIGMAAEFGMCLHDVGAIMKTGVDSFTALGSRSRRSDVGKKSAAIVNADHLELHSQYQAKVDQLMASGLKFTPACAEAASSLGVSDRTVRKYAKNPNPRNTRSRRTGKR